MSEVNVPLLRKAVEWVEEQTNLPEIDREWDQNHWKQTDTERAESFAHQVAHEMWNKNHYGEDVTYFVNSYTTTTGVQVDGYYRYKKEYADIFRKVMNHLAPECKTAYCVAGYVCYLTDSLPKGQIGISKKAMEILGIDNEQAGELFDGANDAKRVREIAEQIAGEKL